MKSVATDTVYSDSVAIDNGSVSAQIFMGLKTKYCDVFGMTTYKQFVKTLLDVIRKEVQWIS